MSNPSPLIPVHFEKVLQNKSYSVILLSALEKQIAIYTESSVGKSLESYLTEGKKLRPLTHDLIAMILAGFDIELMRVVISDLRETVYHSKIFLKRASPSGISQIVELDARPSDAITLAIVKKAPIFCTQAVLDSAFPFELEGKESSS